MFKCDCIIYDGEHKPRLCNEHAVFFFKFTDPDNTKFFCRCHRNGHRSDMHSYIFKEITLAEAEVLEILGS